MNARRAGAAALAVCLLFVFPGTSMGDTFRIKARGSSPADYRWDPSFRHITKGDKVIWKNTTNVTHRVIAYSGRWSKETEVPAGGTTSKRFKKTGAFLYRCTVPGHSTLTNGKCSGMCGEVHVVN
jgi:plastocyanin